VRESDGKIGAALIGRRTFDLGVGPWGGTFAFDGLEAAAKRAKDAAGDKDVWGLGAEVARQLLRAGLLDEVRLHLVPLLMGEGTPLFAGGKSSPRTERAVVAGSSRPSSIRLTTVSAVSPLVPLAIANWVSIAWPPGSRAGPGAASPEPRQGI
jgi:RibD domain-containing protein